MNAINPTSKFQWLVRREFWEYRGGFFWAQVITAMIIIAIAFLMLITAEVTAHQHGISINAFQIQQIQDALRAQDVEKVYAGLDAALLALCLMNSIVLFFVTFFYCLGALYNDRADRSVLFWKSLPLSDLESVLAKLATVTLVAPAIAVAVMILLQLSFLLLMTIFALFHGFGEIGLLWSPSHLLQMWMHLIVRIPVNSLWALPCIGWLFLCSSFVRSKPFLWAMMLPVMSGIVVSFMGLMNAFSLTSAWWWWNIVFRSMLSLIPGSWLWLNTNPSALIRMTGNNPEEFTDRMLSLSALGNQMVSPNLWIGVGVGVVMIAASIYLRRQRIEAIA
jgi:ABC-2 type transport system permease protein